MSLTLYYHPLASFCHKVLVALYENDTGFDRRIITVCLKKWLNAKIYLDDIVIDYIIQENLLIEIGWAVRFDGRELVRA